MKKILLPGILALAVLLIAGFGMNRSMNSYGDLSDMALKNVLALADGEDPEDPDPGEEDDDGGIEVEKVHEKVDYIATSEEIINGAVYICTTIGVGCNGTGNIDCVRWSTTECKRL
ncbi:NVEALA domain-containing protein [uncultured Proteiniphilum sp.]|uniref:NVEALA domain-containing protein n=1 Tax=uncultured Proteiniphilum sp. TaxID=497637 RepID=UPI002602D352|nr:NVEALA domain-containing protein [uncultured Proteiniphilum sp.]